MIKAKKLSKDHNKILLKQVTVIVYQVYANYNLFLEHPMLVISVNISEFLLLLMSVDSVSI